MTKDEALDLALRSLKELVPDESDYAPAIQGQRKRQEKAITAIKQALAAPTVQEPVAFFYPSQGFYWAKPTRIIAPVTVDVKPLPLYITPPAQPAPVQEPVWIQPDHLQKAQRAPFLCRVEPHKRDDFVPLYTTPPAAQRQWVGLTDEEVSQLIGGMPHGKMVRATEAKLKERNV
jgi:hypothetical protein